MPAAPEPMVDIVSPEKRSRMMSGIRGKNTKPEIITRKILHGAGYRFRLHRKDLPGKPDIVLPRYKVAIFVNGCFWHGHENCHLFRLPKSNTEFWEEKIGGNIRRDRVKQAGIIGAGWRVLVIWECALRGKFAYPADALLERVDRFIEAGDTALEGISGAGNDKAAE
jgi:DNA mismatch endonuclease (patch repair protein)